MRTALAGSAAGRLVRSAGVLVCLGAILLSLVGAPPAGGAARALPPPLGIGLIPTESGVGDLSFNWLAYQGLQRAETDLGVQGTVYTPTGPGDYAAQIQQCVGDGNVLCVTVGFAMADATLAAALDNPATHFFLVDYSWNSYPDNLRGTQFAVEQAAYLAGVLVAGMSQSAVVGAVGGIALPPVVAFVDPYLFGAQCAEPGVNVLIDYTGTFVDPDLGAQLAQQQMDQGADAILGCGGMTGNGAILHATQKGAWAVGVDTDQWVSLFDSGAVPGSDLLLTSIVKRVDNAVYDTIADEVMGVFTPGTAVYDLAGEGVSLAPYHEADASIPQAVKDAVEAARQGILDGSIDAWQPCTATSLPGWRQSSSDGFGDPGNAQIPSLQVFDGWLYAGTWNGNAEAAGFEIWRTANGSTWQHVTSQPGNGAADLAVFDGYLYAGTWAVEGVGGAVWRSSDGIAWEPVDTNGFGDPNNGIARFAVLDGMLYAMTWSSTGTEVWRTENGTHWTQFGDDGLGDTNNGGAISSVVYGGRLYLGIFNGVTGAQLWRTDGESWEQMVGDGFGDPSNLAVSSLAEYHGFLYAGLYNDGGVQVWRWSENGQWQQVAGPGGFGNPATNKANGLEVLDGVLYLVVENDDTGLEVWRTANGTAWEQVGFAGFGDCNNEWSYWDNGVTTFHGSLYVATNNFTTGGEVWEMLKYRISLPLVVRAYNPGKITLWHTWSGDSLPAYQEAIDEFNQSHPGIVVEAIRVEDLPGALDSAIPAGTGPDLVAWSSDTIGPWATAGWLAPLDDWIDQQYLEDHFEPAAAQGVVWNGHIWAIPDWQEGIALIYNTDLLGEAQIPEPDDWAGLITQADQWEQAHPGLWYLCAPGLSPSDGAYFAAPIYFGNGMSQYGGYVDEEGNAYLDTPEALAAAQWIYDFRPFGPPDGDYNVCKQMMLDGEAAMWWNGPWSVQDLEDAGIEYGIAPMGSPFVGIRGTMLTANAVARGNDGAAVAFMQYMGSAEVQEDLALANGTIPANTAALNDPDVQAVYNIAHLGESLHLGVPMANHPYAACQWSAVSEATWAVWAGNQPPAEAMAAAQAAIEACVAGMGPAAR